VNQSLFSDPPSVRAVSLLHQEGVFGLIAVVGLAFREGGPIAALAPLGPLFNALLVGTSAGLAGAFALWLIRATPALKDLLSFQNRLVRGWTVSDAVAVALLSGMAEEALIRALLQPIVGLVPAALVFAALHFVPDRRLWLWPVIALGLGLMLGLVFQYVGYPGAAVGHFAINLVALLRSRRPQSS